MPLFNRSNNASASKNAAATTNGYGNGVGNGGVGAGVASSRVVPAMGRPAGGFDPARIFRHPVLGLTFLLAFVGWWTAFISMCVAESELNGANGGPVVGTEWFAIIFQAAVFVHLLLAISYDTLHVHRWQIAIVTAVVVVFAIMGVEYIYPGQQLGGLRGGGALKGVGAGWLILTLVDLIWILWLTSEPGTFLFGLLNPSGTAGLTSFSRNAHGFGGVGNGIGIGGSSDYPRDSSMHHLNAEGAASMPGQGSVYPGGGGAAGGSGYAPAATQSPVRMSDINRAEAGHGGNGVMLGAPAAPMTNANAAAAATAGGVTGDVAIKGRAKCLFSYNASPDDPNEISFNKGEILDVLDSSGKWWSCKTPSGTVGIAPSNYLQLI